jgi:c-di-GMP-binding flagellar brake protein YcgR
MIAPRTNTINASCGKFRVGMPLAPSLHEFQKAVLIDQKRQCVAAAKIQPANCQRGRQVVAAGRGDLMYDIGAVRNHSEQASTSGNIDLIEAQHANAIIELQTLDSGDRYQSTILAVDPTARTIEIDEVFPSGFNAPHGAALNVTLRLTHNRRVTFSTRLLRAGCARYELAMPPGFTYNQRRNCYRFKITPALSAGAEFRDAHDYYCSAQLLDISLTGARLQLNHQIDVAPDQLLHQLTFKLLGSDFLCSAVIKNCTRHTDGRAIVGVEFKSMPRPQQRALEKILAQLHRNLARHKAERRATDAHKLH